MSNNPPSQTRLYTRLINIIKILQFIAYFLVALYLIYGITIISSFYAAPIAFLFLIPALIACISIYITTQVLVAIIDLLSRIERNTRP